MTIATELNRIISAKNDILSAINDKGVSTAGTTSISQCPALINAIQTGGGSTPSAMHSTAATPYQWMGSAEFYITMSQKPSYSFDTPSITASATSWSTSRLGFYSTAIGWKVASFDTGILSCEGVLFSAKGTPLYARPFAANYKPSGSGTPSAIGTKFVWLDDTTAFTTTSTSTVFSVVYSLSAASVLSTSSPIYVGLEYEGMTANFGRFSGGLSASGGDIIKSLPYPDQPETINDTATVSAAYSSRFSGGVAATRPGGEYSYQLRGHASGSVSSTFGNRKFIAPSNTATNTARESASAGRENYPGEYADRIYNCIRDCTGYTSTATTQTATYYSGNLFSPQPTSTYPASAWQSSITGSSWLGQSSVGHLF